MAHLVTIGIPTIGRLPFLKEAVASVLGQRYRDLELVICDNMGPPEVESWCQALILQDPRVRYQRQPQRIDLAQNWNAVVDAARGESLMIMGDDDRLLPAFVETLVQPIADGWADVAFCNHHVIDSTGRRLEKETQTFTDRYGRRSLRAGPGDEAEALVWQNAVPISTSLIRTSEIRRYRFNESLNTPEIELFLRMARGGSRFFFTDAFLAEYRVHGASETARGLRNDRLAESLLPLNVVGQMESTKAALLGPILADATKWCLRRGDVNAARRFASSAYYPTPKTVRQWFIRMCALAPYPLARLMSVIALSHLPRRE